jgi:hypothetical protein
MWEWLKWTRACLASVSSTPNAAKISKWKRKQTKRNNRGEDSICPQGTQGRKGTLGSLLPNRIIGVTVKDACMYRRWQTHTHHNLHTHKHTMLAFCHCDKMSERNNLKEEGFILAFISGGFSPWSFRFTPSFLGHGKAEHYGGEWMVEQRRSPPHSSQEVEEERRSRGGEARAPPYPPKAHFWWPSSSN